MQVSGLTCGQVIKGADGWPGGRVKDEREWMGVLKVGRLFKSVDEWLERRLGG